MLLRQRQDQREEKKQSASCALDEILREKVFREKAIPVIDGVAACCVYVLWKRGSSRAHPNVCNARGMYGYF